MTYRGRCQVVVVPANGDIHSCCVGDEGSKVEDGGNAVIHHHLEEERNSEFPVFPVFSMFSSFYFTFLKILFLISTDISLTAHTFSALLQRGSSTAQMIPGAAECSLGLDVLVIDGTVS